MEMEKTGGEKMKGKGEKSRKRTRNKWTDSRRKESVKGKLMEEGVSGKAGDRG